jgi:hypothetical protein
MPRYLRLRLRNFDPVAATTNLVSIDTGENENSEELQQARQVCESVVAEKMIATMRKESGES